MFGFLLPREENFFDFFDQHSVLCVRAAQELIAIAGDPNPIHEKARRVKDIEHEADAVTRGCTEALHRTFITPIERGDIHALICCLDDIVDQIDGAARALALFEVKACEPELKPMAELVLQSAQVVQETVRGLRTLSDTDAMQVRCKKLHDLESQVDRLYAQAIARLYKDGTDALKVIKWQEVFRSVEAASDHCNKLANIVEGIVIEHA